MLFSISAGLLAHRSSRCNRLPKPNVLLEIATRYGQAQWRDYGSLHTVAGTAPIYFQRALKQHTKRLDSLLILSSQGHLETKIEREFYMNMAITANLLLDWPVL